MAVHRLAGLSARGRWLVSFVLFALLAGCWSLASPLFSGPDEPSHVVNAAAVVRRQLLPRQSSGNSLVRVPAIYESSHRVPRCYIFRPTVSADCAEPFTGSTMDTVVVTQAGRYPPLYYALVGLPTLVWPSEAGVRLMRLLSCLLCAGFLAGALSAAAGAGAVRSVKPPEPPASLSPIRWLVTGVAVAVSPMVLFLAGTVNPNALEIAAAVCLWTCGLALACRPVPLAGSGLVSGAGLAACTLVLTRGLSPVWLACVGTALLSVTGRTRVVELSRRFDVRRWLVAVTVSSVMAVAWVRFAGTNHVDTSTVRFPTTLAAAVRGSLERTDWNLHQMIGLFGWLDTSASMLTYYLWLIAIGMLLLAGLAAAPIRIRVALSAVLVATLAVPIILEYQFVRYLGPVWQGRYTLPLAVGVPLLSAYALVAAAGSPTVDTDSGRSTPLQLRLPRTGIAALAVGHVAAFGWALRRYTVGGGLEHRLDLFSGRWQPPLTAAGLCALFVVVVVLYAGWLNYLLSHRAGAVPHTVDALSGAPR